LQSCKLFAGCSALKDSCISSTPDLLKISSASIIALGSERACRERRRRSRQHEDPSFAEHGAVARNSLRVVA